MTTEVLLKLLEAGYTKKEIDLMEEVEKKPETGKEENPAPENKKEQNPAPENKKEENPAPETDTNLQINELIGMVLKLQGTVDAMQKANAEKAESKTEGRITADSVIKDFFAPTKRKG